MAEQSGMLHGSYALEGAGGTTTKSSGGSSKPTQDIKISDFLGIGELPEEINGFKTKQKQYYTAKSQHEQQLAIQNIGFQAIFMSQYEYNIGEFWSDYAGKITSSAVAGIKRKNELLQMHDSIEDEYKQFEEGDLFDMDDEELLYDEVGNPMDRRSLISNNELETLKVTNPGLAELLSSGRGPVSRGMYMVYQDSLAYGQNYRNVDGIDTDAYTKALHETLKDYGETVIGTDGGKHLIKTSSTQLTAGLDYFHNNIVENNPLLRRTRTAMLSNYRYQDLEKYSSGSETQNIVWENDFATLGNILEATGYDKYESLYSKHSEILDAVKKTENKEWITMMESPQKLRDALYYGDVKEGGGVMSDALKQTLWQNELKFQEMTMLENIYSVEKDGKNKQVLTASQKARGGKLDGYARIKKDIVSKDQAARIVMDLGTGELESSMSDTESLDRGLQYYASNKLNPTEFSEEKFFSEETGIKLDSYVLAKTKGHVIDKFLQYASNNKLIIEELNYPVGPKGQAGLHNPYIKSVTRSKSSVDIDGKITANSELKNVGTWFQSEEHAVGVKSSFDHFTREWYNSRVTIGDDSGSTTFEQTIEMRDLIKMKGFKEWIDKPANAQLKEEMYDIDTYMAGYYDAGTPNTDIQNMLNFQIDKHPKGRFPVEMRDISVDSKYTPITGEPLIKGLRTYLNPMTLEEEQMPLSGRALGVDAIIRGYNPQDRMQEYAMTWMAIPKSAAKEWKIQDNEGNATSYAEIFGGDEFEMIELFGSRPDLLEEFMTPEMKVIAGTDGIKGLLKDFQIVSVPVKVSANFWDEVNINKGLDLPDAATSRATTNTAFPTSQGESLLN